MKARFFHYGKLLISSFILFIAVITVLFFLLEIAPGDAVQSLVGDVPLSQEFREQIIAAYGLDRPVWERYVSYLGNVLTGNLGYSFGTNNEPVLDLILSRAGNTLAIAIPSFVLSTIGGIVLGSIAARTRKRWLDGGISGTAVGLFSLPNFWFGILLILTFSIGLGWFPSQGKSPFGQPGISWEYTVLPIITMATTELAYKTRIMRSSMIESLGQDFIDTARSKGLSSSRVLWQHAMPNALLPMVTISGYSLGFVLAGSVLVEQVFGWPGMGLLFIDAINAKNNMVVLGVVIVLTIAIILINIFTDIIYGLVDPRLRARFSPKQQSTLKPEAAEVQL
ncbi:oligopeptide transport system permease protein AppB [Pseudoclavibacter endophyticus]|uniref:ABC transporter permease n=1 Tax=Pseudoclavibacter endophyticus TaxID=1778590 RepID=UPI00166651C0|nr:ABC transporter permease [Pseudoclavibacter endophyticus]GGA71675.1 oligopeptide transport system permease protein AppB [Pseudoclavibacter endophyticus]